MEHKTMALFVVLAPGVVTAALGFLFAAMPPIVAAVKGGLNSVAQLKWIADIIFESAFIGSAVAGVFVTTMDSNESLGLTFIWFLAALYIHKQLLRRISYLEELEERQRLNVQRAKQAGLMRSILRSELARSATIKEEWRD